MTRTENTEPEWLSYAPALAKRVDLHLASDLRHEGVYLLSILFPPPTQPCTSLPETYQKNQTGPKPLPSPRSKAVAGLLGRDNIFRPLNARHAYGVIPAWKDQPNGPETGDLFAKDGIREAIMIDLQGFPNDVAAPHAAFRLRAISPWSTCFRESFLKAGSEKAQMQLKQIESGAKGYIDGEPKVEFDGNVL